MSAPAHGSPGSLAAPTGQPITDAERIEVLEQRLQRERTARLESERIAEAGLRRLWQAKVDLDHKVELRTAELRRAKLEAVAASEAKSEFLANLGHEVRTPLQTIVSALELSTPADPADRERCRDAVGAAAELRDLFDDLMELAQCEAGAVELHPVETDLQVLTDDVCHRWGTTLASRGLLLVPESEGSATIDPQRVRRIADALVQNAEKFATGGVVGLRLVRRDDEVLLEVADQGPGVPDQDLERLFEPFVQLHGGNDRSVGGAGIGLALVRGLARQMGGDATAVGTDDGGLRVTVRVPATTTTAGEEAP
jgi:signal transduction histidine kinase